MAIRWEAEAMDMGPEPQSGAWITRLTSTVMSNINIYYEQPYGSPDGSRIAYARAHSSDPRIPPSQLCVADLEKLKVCLVEPEVASHWIATSSWSGKVHYLRPNGELIRLDIMTLEKEIVMTHWPLSMDSYLWSVTPDMRYLVTSFYDWEYQFNLVRVDMQNRKWKVIYRHPYVHGHIQVNHVDGKDILLQRNRGMRQNNLRERKIEEVEHKGATHILIDIDGDNERELQIGEPFTAPSTGHASWVSDTGRMGTPVGTSSGMQVGLPPEQVKVIHDKRHPQGNFIVVGPQDDKPLTVSAPEHLFNHASMSKCGNYFVADCFCHGLPGPVEIVIGNIHTNKTRVLVSDCGAQGGGPACSHPHPYFTANNKRVIYNADPHSVCHIHMATVPDGFLKSLD